MSKKAATKKKAVKKKQVATSNAEANKAVEHQDNGESTEVPIQEEEGTPLSSNESEAPSSEETTNEEVQSVTSDTEEIELAHDECLIVMKKRKEGDLPVKIKKKDFHKYEAKFEIFAEGKKKSQS